MTLPTTPIRLQIDAASNPTASPIDLNTGKAPRLWRGRDVAIELGIFLNGTPVDLSNVEWLEVSLYPASIANRAEDSNFSYDPVTNVPFPTTPPAPLFFESIPSTEITPVVSPDDWAAGVAAQATAEFSRVQTGSLDLGGAASAPFVLVVRGLTAEGKNLVYGVANLTVYETGSQGVYLPNSSAPLDVPDGTIFYVPPNAQIPFSLPITIEGSVVVDGGVLVQV